MKYDMMSSSIIEGILSRRKKLRNKVAVAMINVVVIDHNNQRDRHYLTRGALLKPRSSPWRKLLSDGDASTSFLDLTGMTYAAFKELVVILYPPTVGVVRGRPPMFTNEDKVGLYLMFVGSTMVYKHLCTIFGVVPKTCSDAIKETMLLVVRKLRRHPDAEVKFPDTEEKCMFFANLIRRREPSITNCIGFLDGVSFHACCSSDEYEQNAHYSGYHCDTMCNNVFLFAPTGIVIGSSINYYGSWGDSAVCDPIKRKFKRKAPGFSCAVDQGFPRSGEMEGVFIGPISTKKRKTLHPIIRKETLKLHNTYVSLRQSSEWGMRALQGTFPRLKSRLCSDSHRRGDIIESIVLLHNFRTNKVGFNQIQTVFNPHYQQYINIEGYDRIQRYYADVDSVE
mgnify:CR=1 FL=1